MFSGSENHKGTYFEPFEQVGATDMNGTTWFDRTNYFETVPTTALDMALWMESDRMGHLLGAIGQKELDTQRGVVQNEKRQGENRPYGRTDENDPGQCLSGQPSLPARHDRLDGRSRCRLAGRRQAVVPRLLRRGQHDHRAGRRHHAGCRARKAAALLRRHPGRTAGAAPAAVGCAALTSTRGEQKDHVAQITHHPRVERRRTRPRRRAAARAGRRCPRRRQDFTPLPAPRLQGQAGRQRIGRGPGLRPGQPVHA